MIHLLCRNYIKNISLNTLLAYQNTSFNFDTYNIEKISYSKKKTYLGIQVFNADLNTNTNKSIEIIENLQKSEICSVIHHCH